MSMEYITPIHFQAAAQEHVARLSTQYTPPAIFEIYNTAGDDSTLASGSTYYYEIPNQMNFDRLMLEIDIGATGLAVSFLCTSYEELSNADDTGWKDCSELVLGEGTTSLSGVTSEIILKESAWKMRMMLKVVVTSADVAFRAQAVQ